MKQRKINLKLCESYSHLFIETLHPQMEVAVLAKRQIINGALKAAQDIREALSGIGACFQRASVHRYLLFYSQKIFNLTIGNDY